MPRVSTFCPRCGEAIETEVPEAARLAGRAALECPSCRFGFEIQPPRAPGGAAPAPAAPTRRDEQGSLSGSAPPPGASPAPGATPDWSPRATAVRGAGGDRARSVKPVAAGLLLLFASVIGLWLGLTVALGDDLLAEGVNDMSGVGNFTGTVRDAAGDPLEGVQVTMRAGGAGNVTGNGTREATTNAEGRYYFADTEPGRYAVTFRHANHTTVVLETLAYPDEYQPLFGASGPLTSVTMQPGDPEEVERIDMVATLGAYMRWMGIGITVAAALAAAGGVAALRRRWFPLAIIGAVGGILTFGFIVGSVISVVALVLIILSRREFARASTPDAAKSD